MYLQENTLFYLDLGVNVTSNAAYYPPHHVTYTPATLEVTTSGGLGGYAFTPKPLFDRKVNVE